MSRRLTLIIIVIAVVLFASLIAYFIYSFISQKAPVPAATSTTTGFTVPSAGQNQVLPSRISLVSQNPAIDYTALPSGNIIYIDNNGVVRQISQGGESALFNATTSVVEAKISNDGQEILVENSPYNYSIINTLSGTTTPLSVFGRIKSAAFSPATSTKLTYLKNNNLDSSLNILDFSVNPPKITTVANFSEQDYQVVWPYQNEIFLVQKPSAWTIGNALVFNPLSTSTSVFVNGIPGLMLKFLPNSQVLGFSANTPTAQGGFLTLLDYFGRKIQNFSFLTLPSKCAFDSNSSSTLYCAVPRDAGFASQTLPDDYLTRAVYTNDDIYKIDLGGNQIGLYFNDALQNFDMSNIKIFGNTLYFINRYDQKLYKMTLS